jgi:hypothetical protein
MLPRDRNRHGGRGMEAPCGWGRDCQVRACVRLPACACIRPAHVWPSAADPRWQAMETLSWARCKARYTASAVMVSNLADHKRIVVVNSLVLTDGTCAGTQVWKVYCGSIVGGIVIADDEVLATLRAQRIMRSHALSPAISNSSRPCSAGEPRTRSASEPCTRPRPFTSAAATAQSGRSPPKA